MGIALRGSPTVNRQTTGTTTTVTTPTGVVSGDVVVIGITIEASVTSPYPTGFTGVGPTTGVANTTIAWQYLCYKVAGASEPTSYSVPTGNNAASVICMAFSGVNATTPTNGSATNSNSTGVTSFPTGSVTTTVDGDAIISTCNNDFWGVPTAPTGALNATSEGDLSSGAASGCSMCWLAQTTHGAINPTWTDANFINWAGLTLALQPAATGGGATYNQAITDKQSGLDTPTWQLRRPLALDTTAGVDSSVRQAQKGFLDATSALDSATRASQKALGEAHSGLDTPQWGMNRPLGDVTSATDSLSHTLAAFRTLYETFSATDAIQKALTRSQTETISALDSLTRSSQTGGTFYTRSLSESFSQKDLIATWGLVKLVGEAYAATDTQQKGTVRPWYDVTSAGDALSRAWRHLISGDVQSALDALSASSLTGGVLHALTLGPDPLSGRDTQQKALARPLLETTSGQDLLVRQLTRLLSERYSATEAQAHLLSRMLVDALAETDKVTAARALLQVVMDALSATDQAPGVTYAKATYGALALATTLVASALHMTVTLTTTAALAALLSLLDAGLAAQLSTDTSATPLAATLLLVDNGLAMTFTFTF